LTRICIIGGAGFVGSHLVDLVLKEESSEVLVIDSFQMGDNLDQRSKASGRLTLLEANAAESSALSKHLNDFRPEVVWHLAANSDIRAGSADSGVDLISTFGTTAALAIALGKAEYPKVKLIFSSTSAIYGQHSGKIEEGSQCNPESAYGWMKLASEQILKQCQESGLIDELLILRFPNVTGSRQTHGVVKDLVRKYYTMSKDWEILGDGNQTKPYVHVSELCRIMLELSKRHFAGGFGQVNIAPSDEISVSQIVSEIESQGGLGRTPIYGETKGGWAGDIPMYAYDTSRLKSLGLSCQTSFEAIQKSISEEMELYKR
jgi:UDP-glucose 4-epimerase